MYISAIEISETICVSLMLNAPFALQTVNSLPCYFEVDGRRKAYRSTDCQCRRYSARLFFAVVLLIKQRETFTNGNHKTTQTIHYRRAGTNATRKAASERV